MRIWNSLRTLVAVAVLTSAASANAECGRCRTCCEPNIVVHVCPPKKQCCDKPRRSSAEYAPRGNVVESAPVYGYAMPMMGMMAPVGVVPAGYGAEYAPIRRSRPDMNSETAEVECCERLKRDMDRLAARVDALTEAVEKQKTSVDKITEYLEKNKK
jgi:hypothetical protein